MSAPQSAAPARLAVLLSGRGSNFLALHRAVEQGRIAARIVLVLSDRAAAPGLARAAELGLETAVVPVRRGAGREEHDRRILARLRQAEVDWVCLAGYMRLLGGHLVAAFRHRILNVHPSLLPAFPGLDAQRQAWEHGVKVSGCTVHLVDEGLDSGPIVVQRAVSAEGCASPEELAARILEEEHRAYPEALRRLLAGGWRLDGRRLEFESAT